MIWFFLLDEQKKEQGKQKTLQAALEYRTLIIRTPI